MPQPKLVKEKGSPRGLVPSSSFGRLDDPYNAYLAELDPRGDNPDSRDVQFALAASPDIRFREFLVALGEPRCRNYSLATIAKKCDISLPQFAEFWQSAQKQRALARAQVAVVGVTTDMASDARTKKVTCERCDGFGWVYAEEGLPDETTGYRTITKESDRMIRSCPACDATGLVDKIGDIDSRRLLLEMTGLINRKGSAGVQIVQNFGGASIESATDKLNQITFDVDSEPVAPINSSDLDEVSS